MRAILAKELRKRYEARLLGIFPTIERIRNPEFFLIAGNRLYGWELDGGLFFLILLRVAPQVDYFSSDIIWTNCSSLPPRSGEISDLYSPEYEDMHCFNVASFTGDFKDFEWGLTPEMSESEFGEELNADLWSCEDTPKEKRDRSISEVSHSLMSVSLNRLIEIYVAHVPQYFRGVARSFGIEHEWDKVYYG